MVVNILLGVLGFVFSLVTLAALFFTFVFIAYGATCEPDDWLYCREGGGGLAAAGLLGLVIASLTGTLAFTCWRALYRRILGDPDTWWLWFEKRGTDDPTMTTEWLRDVNRRREQQAGSGTEAKRKEEDC